MRGYKGWHPKLREIWTERCTGRCVINRDMRLCFVFVSKNASSTVKRLLDPWEMVRYCDQEDRDFIDNCTTFTILRNPWTRFISAYAEVNKLRKDSPWARDITKKMRFTKIQEPVSRLKQFIRDIDGKIHDLHLVPQADQLDDSRVLIDRYLIFEKLKTQLPQFMADMGHPRPIPHVNKARDPSRNKRLYTALMQDGAAKAVVKRIYAADFALYEEKLRG